MKQENGINYYIGSDGVPTDVTKLETTHLINAMAKMYREIYNSTDKTSFYNQINNINLLKDEVYKRMNTFLEGLK